MYGEEVIKRFESPKNVGVLKGANAVGQIGNVQCGDIMRLYLLVDEKEVIENAKFKTFGCVAAIVSSDIMCDLIKGKTIEQALTIKNTDILSIMGDVPAQKVHCSIGAQEAFEAAVADYRKRQQKESAKK